MGAHFSLTEALGESVFMTSDFICIFTIKTLPSEPKGPPDLKSDPIWARIDQNLDILDFELSSEDMDLLRSFDQGAKGRLVAPMLPDGSFRDAAAPHFPFNIEF